jgi:hypothetical protein
MKIICTQSSSTRTPSQTSVEHPGKFIRNSSVPPVFPWSLRASGSEQAERKRPVTEPETERKSGTLYFAQDRGSNNTAVAHPTVRALKSSVCTSPILQRRTRVRDEMRELWFRIASRCLSSSFFSPCHRDTFRSSLRTRHAASLLGHLCQSVFLCS